MRNKLI